MPDRRPNPGTIKDTENTEKAQRLRTITIRVEHRLAENRPGERRKTPRQQAAYGIDTARIRARNNLSPVQEPSSNDLLSRAGLAQDILDLLVSGDIQRRLTFVVFGIQGGPLFDQDFHFRD